MGRSTRSVRASGRSTAPGLLSFPRQARARTWPRRSCAPRRSSCLGPKGSTASTATSSARPTGPPPTRSVRTFRWWGSEWSGAGSRCGSGSRGANAPRSRCHRLRRRCPGSSAMIWNGKRAFCGSTSHARRATRSWPHAPRSAVSNPWAVRSSCNRACEAPARCAPIGASPSRSRRGRAFFSTPAAWRGLESGAGRS